MARRLTELACQRAKAVPGKRVELFDGAAGVPGLCLRITERGVKSWSAYYRVGGKLRRLTLGRFPDLGLAEARKRARAALEQADRGVDPAGPPERRRGQDSVARCLFRLTAAPPLTRVGSARLPRAQHVLAATIGLAQSRWSSGCSDPVTPCRES